jgi:hypothetical protein
MYTGAMEPLWLIGVYLLGWGAGWAVTRERGTYICLRLKSQRAREQESKMTKLIDGTFGGIYQ